ncbi:3-deoxy-manno-octulosonate cytidylyltransferase [Portibacter lacus]|uniref:3-deoxy-manno-octulosonate cytidylyltransferase n=1 Tax=Portibacter lacus TaxID=1099794 RepID=A0AA37WGD1_9BACT|nr:3-deoxy-manno-octulosonate cytidylyltransferase [Portibacter lacus]GLR18284.1 3-deoxy-manno-octulosonate cytidylyltransferase [Portibacter lacus]
MTTAIIIPARYASTRLPGKALADINGKPLIQWVFEACKKVKNVDQVILATDHELVFNTAKSFGADAIMTSEDHKSGTDRCAEVAENLDCDYIINVQGDEPFIDPNHLEAMNSYLYENPEIDILTLYHEISAASEILNPSNVKLTKTIDQKVLYFSRAVIPYKRNEQDNPYYKHVGIYAFRKDVLLKLAKLKPSMLENTESLEQLRWLENGYNIYALEIQGTSIGVDTPDDLKEARNFLKNRY